jgi:hypothetical protein
MKGGSPSLDSRLDMCVASYLRCRVKSVLSGRGTRHDVYAPSIIPWGSSRKRSRQVRLVEVYNNSSAIKRHRTTSHSIKEVYPAAIAFCGLVVRYLGSSAYEQIASRVANAAAVGCFSVPSTSAHLPLSKRLPGR